MHKVIFESAARAAGTHNSAAITTSGYTGARIFLDVTNANGGSVTPKVQVLDQISGNWVDLSGAAFAATSANGTSHLTIRPGIAETANVSVSDSLGNTIRVVATVATATVTFSIGIDLVR